MSQRYRRKSFRDSFEYIAILIKTIGQLQRQSNFFDLLVNTYEGVWGRRPVPNGRATLVRFPHYRDRARLGSGGQVPQWHLWI